MITTDELSNCERFNTITDISLSLFIQIYIYLLWAVARQIPCFAIYESIPIVDLYTKPYWWWKIIQPLRFISAQLITELYGISEIVQAKLRCRCFVPTISNQNNSNSRKKETHEPKKSSKYHHIRAHIDKRDKSDAIQLRLQFLYFSIFVFISLVFRTRTASYCLVNRCLAFMRIQNTKLINIE